MTIKRRVICTKNREIYEKLSLLNVSPEILLKNVSSQHLDKVLGNINRGKKILESERVGGYLVVRKVNPINFNIYHK